MSGSSSQKKLEYILPEASRSKKNVIYQMSMYSTRCQKQVKCILPDAAHVRAAGLEFGTEMSIVLHIISHAGTILPISGRLWVSWHE
jgi:hypothetical protein